MNTQTPLPIRDHLSSMDGILQIHSIFRTIQGEGPFVGRPAIFVRMFGCNLQCPACDTDYTSKTTMRNRVPQIVEYIQENMLGDVHLYPKIRPLIVITGGEPLRQDIRAFCKTLLRNGIAVQIETNGTVETDLSEVFNVAEVVSPSSPMSMFQVVVSPKTAKIAQAAGGYATAYKYILAADSVDSADGLPARSLEMRQRPSRPLTIGLDRTLQPEVYVQPMDAHDPETNQKNIQAAVKSCMTFGYRLSLQTHKILDLP